MRRGPGGLGAPHVALALAAGLLAALAGGGALRAQEPELREPDVGFVTTPDTVVAEMLRLARVGEGDLVYDLGSGDGRIPITAARRFGARGVGIDIDPARVAEARATARAAGVGERVRFVLGDLFESDFRDATVVTLYLRFDLNEKLRPKLLRELRPGTRVVSHIFDMRGWEPDSTILVDGRRVHLWLVPADARGRWTWRSGSSAGSGGAPGAEHALALEQRFQELRGTLTADGDTLALADLRLRGDSLSFRVGGHPRRDPGLRFEGRLEGDRIRGRVADAADPGAAATPWAASRSGAGEPREGRAP